MIGGFALVAYPAEYGNSGIMTFLVSHQGNVYEKDLGPRTGRIAAGMTEFNPDSTWRRVALAMVLGCATRRSSRSLTRGAAPGPCYCGRAAEGRADEGYCGERGGSGSYQRLFQMTGVRGLVMRGRHRYSR
jgi:hypothetical protein